MIKSKELTEIINDFSTKKILVIGDLIIDVYLIGLSTRLSPEAPVPVVDVEKKETSLGGAANVVCNLRKLGAMVDLCTVVGDDSNGGLAISLLDSLGVNDKFMAKDPARSTIVKTRVVAGNHVITRVDEGTTTPVSESVAAELLQRITNAIASYDAIILSDYDKGTISKLFLEGLQPLARKHSKFIAVDSKRLPFFRDLAPNLVKPNYDEAIRLLNLPAQSSLRKKQLASTGRSLTEITGAEMIAVTLDSDGALVFRNGKLQSSEPAPNIATPHVAGAGDTFMAAFVLAFTCCQNIKQSNELATAAACISINKPGTSSCTKEELSQYFKAETKEVDSLNDLESLCDRYRSEGKRIVLTNGCFDILHSGHVSYLQSANKLGDILIVGVNNDESIKRLKGQHRPINTLADRTAVLSALGAIHHVIAFGNEHDDTPVSLIKAVKPDVFVKGGDYSLDQLPEAATVEELGGRVVIIPALPDHSTTRIIEQINAHQPLIKVISS